MHYRANTVGAQLEIKGLGKNGTLVTCTLPNKNSSPKARASQDRAQKQAKPPARVKELEAAGATGL